uniref:Telomeric repeat-binding factor 2-interacting protein 1 n=1 Tax=Electrophorus electricus TaxID=8005 RepID=A0A4W4FAF1_ELEEL
FARYMDGGVNSYTSPVLFLNTKGEPMRFYIRPGPTKIQLQPLITRSGGVLCRTQESSAILLADPGETSIAMERARQFYISTQYIHDCVVQNQQLDIENYRFSNLQPALTRATARKHRGQGRMCYSLEDDAAIINFIAKCRHEVKGNRVWQQMERQGITTHSWQSMKDRFLKHLQYKISDKSPVRKPKKIPIEESSSSEHNISQTSPEPHMLKKTPNKKDLVEVMKALLKASGDVSLALTYLLGGYDRNVHRPIWTRQDDEKLLSCDSSALPQLQEKYGAQGISKRQAFLKAM